MNFETKYGEIFLEEGHFYFQFDNEEGSKIFELSLIDGKVMIEKYEMSLRELIFEHIAESGDEIPLEEVYNNCGYSQFEEFFLQNYRQTGKRTKAALH